MFGRGMIDCCLAPNMYLLSRPCLEQTVIDMITIGCICLVFARNNTLWAAPLGHIIPIARNQSLLIVINVVCLAENYI